MRGIKHGVIVKVEAIHMAKDFFVDIKAVLCCLPDNQDEEDKGPPVPLSSHISWSTGLYFLMKGMMMS